MCGIHGVMSVSSTYRSLLGRFMEQAFIANSLRGMDSSGVFQIDRSGRPYMHKLALPGPLFVDTKLTRAFMTEASQSRLTVGHVRAATAGKVSTDNAHPFIGYQKGGERVIGVHNGTLTGWSYKPGANLFSVDSDWAISRIADDGADAFEDFSGAYAFVWWNEKNPDLAYMARNKERPLHFVLSPDEETLLFASEPGMLSWLCDRNNIAVKDKVIYSLEEDKLYVFDLGQKKISWSTSNLPKRVYTPVTTTTTTTTTATSASSSGSCSILDDDIPFGGPSSTTLATRTINALIGALGDAPTANDTNVDNDSDQSPVDEKPPGMSNKQWKRVRRERAAQQAKESAMQDSTENFGSDVVIPDQYYSQSGATNKEKQAAKSAGLFGSMQFFIAEAYNPETSELYGEIEDFVVGTGRVRYPAFIRYLTASVADRDWINSPLGGRYVVIIGQTDGGAGVGNMLVCSRLSDEGVEKYRKALA